MPQQNHITGATIDLDEEIYLSLWKNQNAKLFFKKSKLLEPSHHLSLLINLMFAQTLWNPNSIWSVLLNATGIQS